jgi:shikimate dehydrogenase
MRVFGLIGFPLSHSFSKKYFTDKFEREGIRDCRYELFPLEDIQALPGLVEKEPELCGLNVTIPYKQQVIPFLDQMDEEVKQMGACNCIRLIHGKLHGHNTDVIGFEISLRKKWHSSHDTALVLGTGGAAKAVHFVLTRMGIPFREVSRTRSPGVLDYASLTPDIIHSTRLIINTTPLGMYPDVGGLPDIPYDALGPQHFLFDLVYNPEKTGFLEAGERRGATIANGSEMLSLQAEESWKIWNEKGD